MGTHKTDKVEREIRMTETKKELLKRACLLSKKREDDGNLAKERSYSRERETNDQKAISKIKKLFKKQTTIEIFSQRKLDENTRYFSSTFLVDDWMKLSYDNNFFGYHPKAKDVFVLELKCPHCNQWIVVEFKDIAFRDFASLGDIIRRIGICPFCKKPVGGGEC